MSDRLSIRAILAIVVLMMLAIWVAMCFPDQASPAERELVVAGRETPYRLVLYFEDETDLCAWAMRLRGTAAAGSRLGASFPQRVGDHWEVRE
jgi:hypothetical protein